jgi:hypothetical protein
MVRAVPRHRNPPPAANKPATDTGTGEYLAQAFSDIEFKRVLAYSWKRRGGAT